uniref:Uncharacterized protein n=1 Tax=Brassica oleracea TaxID=3712 RepID=A0A3P6DY52_BRAOL|nr:unnamed protein product [Brassica oleracea]
MEKRGWEQSTEKGDTDYFVFKARVDRHGRHFGDRVSTRQTRVPPPAPTTNAMNPSKSSWSQKPLYEEPEQYSSPQYTHSRQTNYRETRRGRDLFSQRSQGQWRAKKPVQQGEKPTNEAEQQQQVPNNIRAPVTLQTNKCDANSINGRCNGGLSRGDEIVLKLSWLSRSSYQKAKSTPGRCIGPNRRKGSNYHCGRDSQTCHDPTLLEG